ncbi:MAG: sensor histidine kinase [Vicinamibacterales bacterium]
MLLNAEQAVNGRSGAAIAIRLSRHDERVECAVTDNGGGMPASTPLPFTLTAVPEDAPRIGLGLEASRWLAEREGGCLTLESVPGGTRAVLTLRA